MINELRNKKLGIIELVARGWKVFKDNFISILIITLIIYLPLDIIDALLERYDPNISFFGLYVIFQLPALMAVAIIVEQHILQETDYTKSTKKAFSALKKAFSRFRILLNTGGLLAGLTFLFFLLFIIPAFIFIVNRFFCLEAVTLRDQRGKAALSYSKSIVQGRWWKVFFLWAASTINLFIIVFIIGTITGLIDLISPSIQLFTLIISKFSISLLGQLNQVFSTICFLNLDFCKK